MLTSRLMISEERRLELDFPGTGVTPQAPQQGQGHPEPTLLDTAAQHSLEGALVLDATHGWEQSSDSQQTQALTPRPFCFIGTSMDLSPRLRNKPKALGFSPQRPKTYQLCQDRGRAGTHSHQRSPRGATTLMSP